MYVVFWLDGLHFCPPSSIHVTLGLLGLPTWIAQKVLRVIQVGMGLAIHQEFHVDVDMDVAGHAVHRYLIPFLDQTHMLPPRTVAGVWI